MRFLLVHRKKLETPPERGFSGASWPLLRGQDSEEWVTVARPETVVRWHRTGFIAYWRWRSRSPGGRPRIGQEVRDLIRRMSFENPLWGAPKIHSELLKLGIEVAQSTVSIYMVSRRDRHRSRSASSLGS
jgi:hypothetical protein